MALTLFDKLWRDHTVANIGGDRALLHIDRIFLHERTGSIALRSLQQAGRAVHNRAHVFCTMDHIIDTFAGRGDDTLMPSGKLFINATRDAARDADVTLFDIGDPNQGISHVVAAELGIALPGLTLICPDSHTCTLGGLGALAWGVGSTEAEHALATSTLSLRKARSMRVSFEGELSPGVGAKDMILHLIAQYGSGGGAGFAIEFAGSAVRELDIEARMTLCNMAVEFSAVTAFVAPDEKTLHYVRNRCYAPSEGIAWRSAVEYWQQLYSDTAAVFDSELRVDSHAIAPNVSWGTNPQQTIAVDGRVPGPASTSNALSRQAMQKALDYMGLKPGQKLADLHIDAAFIGSCTNSRLSDLRAAAQLLKGRRIAPGVQAVCVPGSSAVKRAAEDEGLHRIFIDAGFEWRESGCSMCFYAGGETFGAGKRVISSTNRNFEGRQGPAVRTHIASPITVAASAITGRITDPREIASSSTASAALVS